jgi:hypothetical protein
MSFYLLKRKPRAKPTISARKSLRVQCNSDLFITPVRFGASTVGGSTWEQSAAAILSHRARR